MKLVLLFALLLFAGIESRRVFHTLPGDEEPKEETIGDLINSNKTETEPETPETKDEKQTEPETKTDLSYNATDAGIGLFQAHILGWSDFTNAENAGKIRMVATVCEINPRIHRIPDLQCLPGHHAPVTGGHNKPVTGEKDKTFDEDNAPKFNLGCNDRTPAECYALIMFTKGNSVIGRCMTEADPSVNEHIVDITNNKGHSNTGDVRYGNCRIKITNGW